MLRNKNVLIALSIIVAIGLWMYVVGNVDPQISMTVYEVEVTMSGTDTLEDLGLEATLVSPQSISVTISGKRSAVNKAKKKGLEATIDVSHCDYGKNRALIEVTIPDGVTGVSIDQVSRETAVFKVK